MTTENVVITKLIASNNMMLTNGKVYCREVYLGVNDSPDNWWEVPENEYRGPEEAV